MKSIKQIRNDLEVLSESVESASEMRKLTTLVRAGLFDANKLTMLKRALNKDNVKMTKAERDTLLELLDKLLNLVTSNQQVFTKVKQSVSEDVDVLDGTEYQELNESMTGSANDINNIPPLIVMRRRAIRIFPDGQKVALYWADKINKFISVPFESIGISEQSYADLYRDDDNKSNKSPKNLELINRLRRQKVNQTIANKKPEKEKSEKKERERKEGKFAKISNAAGGGLTGANAALMGLAGAGIRAGAIAGYRKMKKTLAKEEFKERLQSKRNLRESQQLDENPFAVLAPLVPLATAALRASPAVGRAAISAGAKYLPRAVSAGKNLATSAAKTTKDVVKNVVDKVKNIRTARSKTPKPKSGLSKAEREALRREKIEKGLAQKRANKAAEKPSALRKVAGAAGAAGAGAGLAGLAGGGNRGDSSGGSEYNRPAYNVNRNVRTFDPYDTARGRAAGINFAQQAQESVLFNKLKMISESSEVHVHEFIDGNVEVTPTLATKLLETYSKLNGKNKSSIREMINKDKNSFIKVAKFSAER